MDFTALIEAYLRRVEERGLARLEAELRQLADALDAWLHGLLAHPRPDWRERWEAFLAEQEAVGRIPTSESKQSVVEFLESWAATIDWTRAKEQLSGESSLAVLEPWAELQLDGTPVRPSNRFGAQEFPGPPELPEEEGPGMLDELLDPQLEPLVSSAEEYRKSQIEAHGDSYWGMFFRTLNQAIHRYGFGIEERHESLESPSERTAGDIADFSKGASDIALGAAAVGAGKTPLSAAPRDTSWKNLVVGKAQATGSRGHATRIYREAIKMAKSGRYDKIWLNRAYSTATGTKTTPRRLPDIIGRRETGEFDAIEVPSKTNTPEDLIERNEKAMNQLSEHQRGQIQIKRIRKHRP